MSTPAWRRRPPPPPASAPLEPAKAGRRVRINPAWLTFVLTACVTAPSAVVGLYFGVFHGGAPATRVVVTISDIGLSGYPAAGSFLDVTVENKSRHTISIEGPMLLELVDTVTEASAGHRGSVFLPYVFAELPLTVSEPVVIEAGDARTFAFRNRALVRALRQFKPWLHKHYWVAVAVTSGDEQEWTSSSVRLDGGNG